jgi:23S rRNA (cytidine1920-2'-O)/16S rRNA (cytidine1409-2'-O)-methyltransferase
VHDEVCAGIVDFASSLGCTGIRVTPSPIEGGDGNREFLLGARIG